MKLYSVSLTLISLANRWSSIFFIKNTHAKNVYIKKMDEKQILCMQVRMHKNLHTKSLNALSDSAKIFSKYLKYANKEKAVKK